MRSSKQFRHTASFAVIMTVLIILISCSKDNPYGGSTSGAGDQPGANEVWIQGMSYTPSPVTVKAGTTIKWTNKDAVAHTVTADDNSFDSGNIAANGTFSHTFSSAGTISYHCTYHSYMKASVIVQ